MLLFLRKSKWKYIQTKKTGTEQKGEERGEGGTNLEKEQGKKVRLE